MVTPHRTVGERPCQGERKLQWCEGNYALHSLFHCGEPPLNFPLWGTTTNLNELGYALWKLGFLKTKPLHWILCKFQKIFFSFCVVTWFITTLKFVEFFFCFVGGGSWNWKWNCTCIRYLHKCARCMHPVLQSLGAFDCVSSLRNPCRTWLTFQRGLT